METKIRCQSCGMPLTDGFFGTNKAGSETTEYCKFCFQDGAFLQPEITAQDMIQMSVDNMTQDLSFDQAKAEQLAKTTIPNLKRWKSN